MSANTQRSEAIHQGRAEAHPVSTEDVRRFYDDFSARLLRDYFWPNRRILAQLEFLREAIPRDSRRVLVVGCGAGQGAAYIARRITPGAEVVGIDISPANIRWANALFTTPRVRFLCADVLADGFDDSFDVIVLPDVYEHIPSEKRSLLHSRLAGTLAADGRLLITVLTPAALDWLRSSGPGVQIVDEDVSFDDLARLATDIGGRITYFAAITVWQRHDYYHALIERSAESRLTILPRDRLTIHRMPSLGMLAARALAGEAGLLRWPWRRLRVWRASRRLRRRALSGPPERPREPHP